MRKNTHDEFFSIEHDGKIITGFMSGVPDKCQHDDDGPMLHFNDDGEYFKESDMPDYKTDPEGWEAFNKEHRLTGGCCSCSKCGKPYELDIHAMP